MSPEPSLASRMASANGIGNVADFCRDMTISRPRLRSGDPEQLARLASLASADLDRLKQSTIVSDRPNFSIGGHRILRIYLIRPRFRICPRCIVEDMEHGVGPEAARPWFRSAWSVSLVRSCPIHHVLLHEVDTSVPGHLAEDVSLIVRRSLREIRTLADTAETLPPSGLETWAADRLAGKDGHSTYLSSLSFCTSMRLVEMIGASVIHGKTFAPSKLTDREWFAAGRAGFPIVAAGERSILDYLTGFHQHFTTSNRGVGGRLLYGTLYPWLNFVTGDDFDRVRAMIREHVIDSFPVGPGDVFLGDIDRRRWHSVQTASKEYGAHPLRLRRLLREAGFIGQETDGMSDHRVIFPVEKADAFLRGIKDTMMTREAEEYAGMTRSQWAVVVEARLVKPIVKPGRVHATYSKHDIDAFIASVGYNTGDCDLPKLVPVAKAAKLATCTIVTIIQLLQERRLKQVAVDPKCKGFSAILVNPEEVKTILPQKELPGLTPQQVAERIGVNPKVVTALLTRRYIRHQTMRPFSNRSGIRIVRPEDADAFAKGYISLPQAAELVGQLSPKTLKVHLDGMGIQPAIQRSEVGGFFYDRTAIIQFEFSRCPKSEAALSDGTPLTRDSCQLVR